MLCYTLSAQTSTPPAGGTGTENDPYQIGTLENLYWLSQTVTEWDKHFIQTANIDASTTASWDSGMGFSPIGRDTVPFTGVYDGQGMDISDLTIDRNSNYIGLFGYATGATLENITIANCTISGVSYVAPLAALIMYDSYVNNCHASGMVTGTSQYAAGLIGRMGGDGDPSMTTIIEYCSSSCTVSGNEYTAGLVAENQWHGQILRCYATGDVTFTARIAGGLIANNKRNTITKSCYSTGDVTLPAAIEPIRHYIGGFVGSSANSTKISNCYSTGNVNAKNAESVGGFAGRIILQGTVENCYSTGAVEAGTIYGGFLGSSDFEINNCFWDMETSGIAVHSEGVETNYATGLSTVDMQTELNFTNAGWDFCLESTNATNDYWLMDGITNGGYPFIDVLMESEPQVASLSIINEGATEVELQADIQILGGLNTNFGICWNTTGTPTLSDNTVEESNPLETGLFTSVVEGLNPEQNYYFRAYASNGAATVYSNEISFTTLSELTLNGTFTVNSKVYDGMPEASINTETFTLSGIAEGDDVSIGTVYTEYVSTGVGEGIEVIVVGVDLSGANAAQYSVTTETAPTSTGDITTKELTISGTMANNKTYNSSTVASLTGTTLVGVVAGDVVYLIGGSVAAFEQAEVGTGLIVNTNMYLTGADAANYTVTPPIGLTADITPAELTVANAVASDKIYDATVSTSITGATLVGVFDGDEVLLGDAETGEFTQSAVGDNIAVSVAMTISGADAANYTLTQPSELMANITPLTLSIEGAVAQNKTYDGTDVAEILGATLVGVINEDDVALENSTLGAFAQSSVGEDIAADGLMTISGIAAGNYALELPTGMMANITQAELTVADALAQNKVYDGTINAEITGATLSGVFGEDAVELVNGTSGSFNQAEVGNDLAVSVQMGISGADMENYFLTQPTGLMANITPATLTISADNLTRGQCEENPTFTYQYAGFVLEEDESILDVLPQLSCSADELSAPTDYDIIISGASAANYSIQYMNGLLTVEEDLTEPVLEVQNIQIVLDEFSNGSIEAVDVVVSNDDLCGIDRVELSQSIFTGVDVGTVEVSVTSFDMNGNSAVKTVQVKVDITTGIDKLTADDILSYPNPVEDVVNIELPISGADISLKNALGENILSLSNVGASESIDLSNYESGLYFMAITAEGKTVIKKIIKE